MIYDYLTVRSMGFITYCDAMIATTADKKFNAVFISLVSTPSNIKATSASLFQGNSCNVVHQDDRVDLEFLVSPCGYRTRKIGDTVNKVMISPGYFPDIAVKGSKQTQAAVVYGPDMSIVTKRAFLRLDAGTTIPLKPEWQSWLWDEVLQPEKLYSFGGEELKEAYLMTWPDDDTLQGQILEGVSSGYLA